LRQGNAYLQFTFCDWLAANFIAK